MEYEFTTVFDLDVAHQAKASKDHTQIFTDKNFTISEQTGAHLQYWLEADQQEQALEAILKQ